MQPSGAAKQIRNEKDFVEFQESAKTSVGENFIIVDFDILYPRLPGFDSFDASNIQMSCFLQSYFVSAFHNFDFSKIICENLALNYLRGDHILSVLLTFISSKWQQLKDGWLRYKKDFNLIQALFSSEQNRSESFKWLESKLQKPLSQKICSFIWKQISRFESEKEDNLSIQVPLQKQRSHFVC